MTNTKLSFEQDVLPLVKNIPNDVELGRAIRSLYMEHERSVAYENSQTG